MLNKARPSKLNLSQRIFAAMFFIILFTAVFILVITVYHFKNQSQTYHEILLKRKEQAVLTAIDYELERNMQLVNTNNVYEILENKILGIADINKQDINVYDIKGNLLLSTESYQVRKKVLSKQILDNLKSHETYKVEPILENDNMTYLTTYSYIYNLRNQPIAIVNLPYYSNDAFFKSELYSLLKRFGGAILFVLVVGGYVSWVMANQITRKLKIIAYRIEETEVVGSNEPIVYRDNDEIKVLVDSYNEMLHKLQEQSKELAKVEREEAWREMAKQVAHEIKNPLTPMSLMIQNYIRKFDPKDPDIVDKTKRTVEIILNQIGIISSIVEAFSDFAKMPLRKDETEEIVSIIRASLEIFPPEIVFFESDREQAHYNIDRIYLTRIIINITKNAIQSVPDDRKPLIIISLRHLKDAIVIKIMDNGIGIPVEMGEKIFVPKFTTKTTGMGLGLGMVKKIIEDYRGAINFTSQKNIGTTFTIKFPI